MYVIKKDGSFMHAIKMFEQICAMILFFFCLLDHSVSILFDFNNLRAMTSGTS